MNHPIRTTLLSSLLTSCTLGVMAQQADVVKACGADVKNLCSGIERGEGRIAQCLRQNEDRLSEGCKSKLRELQQSRSKGSRQNRRADDAQGSGN